MKTQCLYRYSNYLDYILDMSEMEVMASYNSPPRPYFEVVYALDTYALGHATLYSDVFCEEANE